jgi:hypothetical protein
MIRHYVASSCTTCDTSVGSLFRPEAFYWRLLLTLRKFFIVSVALMFSASPLFQAWYAIRFIHTVA